VDLDIIAFLSAYVLTQIQYHDMKYARVSTKVPNSPFYSHYVVTVIMPVKMLL